MKHGLLSVAFVSVVAVSSSGCPKGLPGRGGSGSVDPNTCGNLAINDAGRKLHAFLEATASLERTVTETVSVMRTSCVMMGKRLAMTDGQLSGETNDVCARVFTQVRDNMGVAFKAEAKLNVQYKPAVCTLDVQAYASATAQCEAKAEADVKVTCEGSCSGTCNGTCNGTCSGTAGTGGNNGQCNGQCNGTCQGSCSGGCDGHANVDASAECRAKAEAQASANLTCTKAELTVEADASAVLDTSKAEMTLAALREGLPEIFSASARLKPLKYSVEAWAVAAKGVGASANDLAASFKAQALCVSGQIAAAVGMVTNIQANVSVSVEVSASAHGSIGAK